MGAPVVGLLLALASGLAAVLGYLAGYRTAIQVGDGASPSRLARLGNPADTHASHTADGTVHSGLGDTISAHFAMLTRYEFSFSIVILDIDHFHRVNQQRGRIEGDRILQSVAQLLGEAARETDVVVRYGGDKFFVLMPQTGLEGACEFGERFRETIQRHGSVTVTGGIAMAVDGDTPGSLLSRADEALEGAKRAGHNRVFRHDGYRTESILDV